ncbi:MAG: RNA methyltransferase [Dysgonamonadaceae bacterium]|jgi:TrmH family RNA methyltransferase|nr:RNA methyltransferase [Dysgonamonadaceae bacterium]
MLSKSKIKFIKSLEKKKYRSESGCFPAEGNKLVADILPFFECELLITTPQWLATQGDIKAREVLVVEKEEIRKASLLKNPQDVIAVFRRSDCVLQKEELTTGLTLVLDGIQDPGNLGAIIRIADWFGIKNVICSPDTVDIYNPKTIQATMGSLARVKIVYLPLTELLTGLSGTPVYGTFLEGTNIYEAELSSTGLIVMGNEGNGISPALETRIVDRLYVPNYPPDAESTNSLNVAVTAAIVCAEFRRRQIKSI